MALNDVKISALTELDKAGVTGEELIPLARDGGNYSVSISTLKEVVTGNTFVAHKTTNMTCGTTRKTVGSASINATEGWYEVGFSGTYTGTGDVAVSFSTDNGATWITHQLGTPVWTYTFMVHVTSPETLRLDVGVKALSGTVEVQRADAWIRQVQ